MQDLLLHKRRAKPRNKQPLRRRNQRQHPANRRETRHVISARVVHVGIEAEGTETEWSKYFNSLLTLAGLSNADVYRMSGVHFSIISKWRKGETNPTIANLRPVADALGIPRVTMFVRAGLIEAEDVAVSALALEIDEKLARTPEPKRSVAESHFRLLLDGLDQQDEQRRRGK